MVSATCACTELAGNGTGASSLCEGGWLVGGVRHTCCCAQPGNDSGEAAQSMHTCASHTRTRARARGIIYIIYLIWVIYTVYTYILYIVLLVLYIVYTIYFVYGMDIVCIRFVYTYDAVRHFSPPPCHYCIHLLCWCITITHHNLSKPK